MYLKKVLLFVLSCLGAVTCLGQKVEGGRRNLIVGERDADVGKNEFDI